MILRPPRSTLTDTLFPYTTLFRSAHSKDRNSMKLLRNSGNERVIDRLRDWLQPDAAVDFMSPVFSLYAFAEMHDHLSKIGHCRILLGSDSAITNSLYGGPADIAARGKLQGRWLAQDRKSTRVGKECVSTCRSRWAPYH